LVKETGKGWVEVEDKVKAWGVVLALAQVHPVIAFVQNVAIMFLTKLGNAVWILPAQNAER